MTLVEVSTWLGNWLYFALAGLSFFMIFLTIDYWRQVRRDWWRWAFAASYVLMVIAFGFSGLFTGVRPYAARDYVTPYTRIVWFLFLVAQGVGAVGKWHTLYKVTKAKYIPKRGSHVGTSDRRWYPTRWLRRHSGVVGHQPGTQKG